MSPLVSIPPYFNNNNNNINNNKYNKEIKPPWFVLLLTYFSYFNMIVCGRIRDFFAHLCMWLCGLHDKNMAPVVDDWESFFIRRLYNSI